MTSRISGWLTAGVAGRGLIIASVALRCAGAVQAQAEAPSVTPYRPSVSTPAALSAPGWLEVETGYQSNRGAGSERRASLPYTLKLAFSPDWGLRLGGEAAVRQTDSTGARSTGAGDIAIVLKRRFAIDGERAFGVELGGNLATARAELGSGHSALTLTGIYSADLDGGLHTDLNLGGARSAGADAGVSRDQIAGAAALSGAIGAQWGWVVELSGTRQRGSGVTSQGLAALSYSLSRTATVDFGMARSLRAASSDRSWFAGITVLTAKLF